MKREDIKEVLNVENNRVITGKNRDVEVDVFIKKFGDSDLTLSSLLDNENVSKKNGWKKRFEELNEKGVLPD